jgi:hypothetical protein
MTLSGSPRIEAMRSSLRAGGIPLFQQAENPFQLPARDLAMAPPEPRDEESQRDVFLRRFDARPRRSSTIRNSRYSTWF